MTSTSVNTGSNVAMSPSTAISRRSLLLGGAAAGASMGLASVLPAFAEESSSGSQFPLTITTSCFDKNNENWVNTVQVIQDAPTKILVGGQTLADALVYFGLSDLIYGIVYPNGPTTLTGEMKDIVDSIPVITEDWDVTEEELYAAVDAGVDLILTGYVLVGLPSTMDVEQLNDLGVDFLYAYDMQFDGAYKLNGSHLSYSGDVFDLYRDLGTIFDVKDVVEDYIADQHGQMRSILSKVNDEATDEEKNRYVFHCYYKGTADGITYNYTGTLVQEFVSNLGCIWLGDFEGLKGGTLEVVMDADPDVILYNYSEGVDTLMEDVESLQDLKAVKNGTIYGSTTFPTTSNTAGLDLASLMLEIAQYLYPNINFSE
jgi:ABC-type Fe3+-hydroxamate transport system substrate-binding protein